MELFQEFLPNEKMEWRTSSVRIPIDQPTKGNVRTLQRFKNIVLKQMKRN